MGTRTERCLPPRSTRCARRRKSSSNHSIPDRGFYCFSTIWGICSSFKANSNGPNFVHKYTVSARTVRLLMKSGNAERRVSEKAFENGRFIS
jgi:hypothetical protein